NQGLSQPPHQAPTVFDSQLVLPDAESAPAVPAKCSDDEEVAAAVGEEFASPEGAVIGRHVGMFRTAVPKTAIDENGHFEFQKNEIRLAKDGMMPTPPGDLLFPQQLRKNDLRFLVPAPANVRHHQGALFYCENIGHQQQVTTVPLLASWAGRLGPFRNTMLEVPLKSLAVYAQRLRPSLNNPLTMKFRQIFVPSQIPYA